MVKSGDEGIKLTPWAEILEIGKTPYHYLSNNENNQQKSLKRKVMWNCIFHLKTQIRADWKKNWKILNWQRKTLQKTENYRMYSPPTIHRQKNCEISRWKNTSQNWAGMTSRGNSGRDRYEHGNRAGFEDLEVQLVGGVRPGSVLVHQRREFEEDSRTVRLSRR